MSLREFAKGRWPEIISAVLGPEFTNTRKHQPCPRGEGTDRYRFSDKLGTGNFFCGCSDGGRDGFSLIQCVKQCSFADAAKMVEGVIGKPPEDDEPMDTRPNWAGRLRSETVRSDRSRYLERRGLEVAPAIEFHRSLPYYRDGAEVARYPAMLAPLMLGHEFITYHVTYLDKGGKAPVRPCRKILPAKKSLDGAACPLYEPSKTLGIAEGIETAIAAKILFGVPVWAALNTALMAKWQPPAGVQKAIIFADHDANYAGHAAAYQLAHRLSKTGYSVDVRMPETLGDWNDELLRQRNVA